VVNHLLTGLELSGFAAAVVAAGSVDWRLGVLVYAVLAVIYANLRAVAMARAAKAKRQRGEQ
jgi:hypothetical protein